MTPTTKLTKVSSNNIVNPASETFLTEMYRPLDDKFLELRLECEKDNIPLILPDCEKLLHTLLLLRKPERVLEIGTAEGYSACFISKAGGCQVTTIEKDPVLAAKAVENIERMGLSDRITVINGDARDEVWNLEGKYGMAFIDGAKSSYMEFFDAVIAHMGPGDIIVCDNILLKGMTFDESIDVRKKHKTHIRKLREFLTYINERDDVVTSILTVGDGISLTVIK